MGQLEHIVIVGAGAAGLMAARELAGDRRDDFAGMKKGPHKAGLNSHQRPPPKLNVTPGPPPP
jgi:thioredoxin reductase